MYSVYLGLAVLLIDISYCPMQCILNEINWLIGEELAETYKMKLLRTRRLADRSFRG